MKVRSGLKTLTRNSLLVGQVSELEAILLAADTLDEIDAVLQRFRGSYAQTRA